jgi:hypothetical protein
LTHGTIGAMSGRDEAIAWLDQQLAATGAERTGPVEAPHVRPWATALRAPTSRGVVWLKAPGPGTAFEVPLYELLHRLAPGHVLEPIAVDVERAWVLLPDGGVTLGDRFAGRALLDALPAVYAQYAQLQRDLAPHVGELVALGIADHRPAAMPERYEEALLAVRERAGGSTYARLEALRADVASAAARLADAPGEPSIDHNDLHPGNVFASGRIFDWGDAVVAHPFASMLVGLGWVRDSMPEATESDIDRARDAYLDVFADLAPRDELLRTMDIATRLARISRSLIWHRAIDDAGEVPQAFADAPASWLATLDFNSG